MRRLAKSLLLALLFSLLLGFAIGTAIRLRLERPVEYIGAVQPARPPDRVASSGGLLDADRVRGSGTADGRPEDQHHAIA